MECVHRPINVRRSIIKTANLGLRPSDATPTTAGVAMDTVTEEKSSDTVNKQTSEAVTKETDKTVTKETSDEVTDTETIIKDATGCQDNATATGCQGDTIIRTYTTDNSELSYAGSVTITTAQPAANITGHTGYLTFATLGPQ